jgi:hypothetical protein
VSLIFSQNTKNSNFKNSKTSKRHRFTNSEP